MGMFKHYLAFNKIRDYDLPNLNIIIEDKGKDKSIWKFNLN